MSRKRMKNCKIFRAPPLEIVNEPEEGEIVDGYDLIVSSDEELCMRQRIRELEAENAEIEQIALISRSYVDKINQLENSRAAQVPTDASSISSTEFVTPKKRKRRKSKEHKRKQCHRQHQYEQHLRCDVEQIPLKTRLKKSHCKRKQKLFAKKHKKNHSDRFIHKEVNKESLSLESPKSSESSSLTDTDNYENSRLSLTRKETLNKEKYIRRHTLRLAVARNAKDSTFPYKKSCLKDKLLRQELPNTTIFDRHAFSADIHIHRDDNDNDDDDDVQVIENEPDIQTIDEDSTDSLEEKELRLIALKSAVLKKHMARKMRNAEAAYSPTDFEEMFSSAILRQDNKVDDIDVVDLEADDSQTAYVPVSPETSPQLMMLDDQDESQQMANCKPVDMDIANSDSEDAVINSWSRDDISSLPKYSFESLDFSNTVHYGFYMQELNELAPPPPGVDDYEHMPPPPPYHMLSNEENKDMDFDDAELMVYQHRIEETQDDAQETKRASPDKEFILPPKSCLKEEEEVEDEEEEALRALLLSKFRSPKNQKKTKNQSKIVECQDTPNKKRVTELSNCKHKPTEIILKEAVKRLKIHSQTELCKEATLVDVSNKNRCTLAEIPEEYPKNNNDSNNILQKLRNRLNKSKNQSESLNAEQINGNTDENLFGEKDIDAISVNHDDVISKSLEATNMIDVSDITRRLQKIKETVLNLTYSPAAQNPPICLNSEPQDLDASQCPSKSCEIVESSQSCSENVRQHNNLLNTVSERNELNTALTQNKTVKADFDITTNQTTFKVTISNNAVIKSEGSDTTNALNDVICKENNNNVSKEHWKDKKTTGKTRIKNDTSSETLIKIPNETTATNCENNAQVIKSISDAKPIVNDVKLTSTPAYSMLHTTKIVKPNKVINGSFESNARQFSHATEPTIVLKASTPETNVSDNSRLITSTEQIKRMCVVSPFVINIQNSSNESSDSERIGDYDSLYKPLYDYNDIASPLSLNLESPCRTPLRSNSPTDGSTKNADMVAFKLTTLKSSVQAENINKATQNSSVIQSEKTNRTPLAVRHLPAAAQKEYRRLVHRMKLLESKRKSASVEENKKECTAIMKTVNSTPVMKGASKENDKADSVNSTLKPSLVKKVLLRNASNNTRSTAITTNGSQIPNGSSTSSKLHKSNVLRSYESLYVKFGAGIVNNLDKSLKLVEEAKIAKIAKLKLETRLKELKAEMDILQAKHKEEQQKISRIYPNICNTNELITTLKQKRSKVFKAALNLGKTVKGETYRLNNDLKDSITSKSKKLATEIKIVNSIKVQDIANLERAKIVNTTEQQTSYNTKKNIEDCRKNSNGDNKDIELNPNTAANNTLVCSTRDKDEQEENDNEISLKIEVGGNTEFQSPEHQNSKSDNNKVDTSCRQHKAANLTNDDAENSLPLSSYISPLEHLRNIDSNVDPNGVICPYDLMGNCEDVTCKYVHISGKS